MILNDYLRSILNLNRNPVNSDWKLDPRERLTDIFDPQGIPRGIGNQVSAEFNMIYRWHSAVSNHDEAWANDFMANLMGPGVDASKRSLEIHYSKGLQLTMLLRHFVSGSIPR
jgi:hypothetical protein